MVFLQVRFLSKAAPEPFAHLTGKFNESLLERQRGDMRLQVYNDKNPINDFSK